MWERRFSLDPTILGRTFVLNGTPTTLVGIMPKRFTKRGADVWYPVELDRADTERWFIYQGRLKPGVTLKQVEADLLPIAQRWAKDHPKDYPKRFSIEARVTWTASWGLFARRCSRWARRWRCCC